MIEFQGIYSESSKKFCLRLQSMRALSVVVPIICLFAIVDIVISVILDLWVCIIFLFPLILLAPFAMIAPYLEKQKYLQGMLPDKVIISKEAGVSAFWKDDSFTRPLDSVKKIVSTGEQFLFVFYNPKRTDIICQQDLLVEGTLEEFENIFAGKIVRKLKKERHKSAK